MRVMAATSHPLATLTALDVLRRGGNAIDAAVAAVGAARRGRTDADRSSAAIASCCCMRRGEGEVIALNGSGWAPAAAKPRSLSRAGHAGDRGRKRARGHGAGRRRLMGEAHRRPRHDGARRSARSPPSTRPKHGYPVTERVARDWAKQVDKLRRNAAATEIFLPDGAAPRPGDGPSPAGARGRAAQHRARRARGLLRGLDRARHGRRRCARPAACTRSRISPTTRRNMSTPISASYRGYDVWECPPNGQGLVPLVMLKALEGFDLLALGRHCRSSAVMRSWRSAGRPMRTAIALSAIRALGEFQSRSCCREKRAEKLRRRVYARRRNAGLDAGPRFRSIATPTFVAVVDRDRNTVAFINSIFDDFGCGIVSPASGVIFHNRACGFVLERGHPNAIAGRKRPLQHHHPGDADASNGKAVMPFGVTGGQFQPFGQVQILTNILDHGMGIQAAIDRAAAFSRPATRVEVESTVPAAVGRGPRGARAQGRAGAKPARHRSGDLDRLGARASFAAAPMAVATVSRRVGDMMLDSPTVSSCSTIPRGRATAPYDADGRDEILSLAAFRRRQARDHLLA